jgi:hypothetical protein
MTNDLQRSDLLTFVSGGNQSRPIYVAICLDADNVAVKFMQIFVKLGWPAESNVRVAVVSFEGGGVEHRRMSKVYLWNKYP